MTLITVANNPTLYNKLYASWQAQRYPGWLVDGGTHYRVINDVNGQPAFSFDTNQSMYDSRSWHKSKPATYTKLDK